MAERSLPSISTNDDIQYDYEDITVLGKAVNAEFSCNADGFEISNRTGTEGRLIEDSMIMEYVSKPSHAIFLEQ